MIDFDSFRRNLDALRSRIRDAADAVGRDANEIAVLPVTKSHPRDAVDHALRAGLRAVGENRVQEAEAKGASLDEPPEWELIGHLQSNKARRAVAFAACVQSADSVKLLRRLDRCAEEAGRATLPVLLQINAGDDPHKFGFATADAEAALERALDLPRLRVDGLMTIAPLNGGAESAQRCFATLRELRDRLAARGGAPLPQLSMGMSEDLEPAVRAGSTQIRVGSALFGERPGA